MTTPTPQPGDHHGGTEGFADPEQVRQSVRNMVAQVNQTARGDANLDRLTVIESQAQALSDAHDVLASALATVDKV